MVKLSTARPEGECRSSGSRPKRPRRITIFLLIARFLLNVVFGVCF